MATIRIRTILQSETLVLPELKLLVGKTVDISVTEHPDTTTTDKWAKAAEAVKQLTDYDHDGTVGIDPTTDAPDESTQWRGVFVVESTRPVLFEHDVVLQTTNVPRWQPTVQFDPRWVSDDE